MIILMTIFWSVVVCCLFWWPLPTLVGLVILAGINFHIAREDHLPPRALKQSH